MDKKCLIRATIGRAVKYQTDLRQRPTPTFFKRTKSSMKNYFTSSFVDPDPDLDPQGSGLYPKMDVNIKKIIKKRVIS
jgi:hypothetical protein